MAKTGLGLMCSVFISFACLASAQTLIDAGEPEKIADIARGYGSASLSQDGLGDPMIRGRIDGTLYVVFFYGCDGGMNCRSIQFRGSWGGANATQDTMNSWNLKNRFGKAYLDKDGDPVLEWDVNMLGGVSLRNLDDSFDWWAISIREFEDYIR